MRKLLLLALVLGLYAMFGPHRVPEENSGGTQQVKTEAEPKPVAAAPKVDKSPEMQAGRKKLIEKLISTRVFHKVETPGNAPRVYVLPAFYELDFDMKQQFVSVVYAYYFDGSDAYGDLVRVFDARTNKSVGTYTIATGGLTLD